MVCNRNQGMSVTINMRSLNVQLSRKFSSVYQRIAGDNKGNNGA